MDSTGTLTHREARILVDNGAYNHSGASVTGRRSPPGLVVPHERGRACPRDARRHQQAPGGQFRGYGHPQVAFADRVARWTSWPTPRARPDRLPDSERAPVGRRHRAGWRLHSAHLVECLEAVRDAIGWREKRARAGRARGGRGRRHARQRRPHLRARQPRRAGIDVRADGTVRVRFGGADAGTGQRTVIAQVAAEELGVDLPGSRSARWTRRRRPSTSGSWSSRGHGDGRPRGGHGRAAAAQRLRELAADKLGVGGRGRRRCATAHAVAGTPHARSRTW